MSKSFFVKGIYASGMVLQRNTVNCIYGGGVNASLVELEFRGKKNSVAADKNGEWKIEFNDDKTVKITNAEKNKTIQYSIQHTSFGSYEEITNVLPCLFKKVK